MIRRAITKICIIKSLFLLPSLIAWFGLMLSAAVTAQTFTTLHSFASLAIQLPG